MTLQSRGVVWCPEEHSANPRTASIGAIFMDADPFAGIDDGRALAQAIVDTLREPLLVLDKDLRVVAASRSFYLTFKVQRQDVQGRPIYALGDGQWNIPS